MGGCFSNGGGFIFKWGVPHRGVGVGIGFDGGEGFQKNRWMGVLAPPPFPPPHCTTRHEISSTFFFVFFCKDVAQFEPITWEDPWVFTNYLCILLKIYLTF